MTWLCWAAPLALVAAFVALRLVFYARLFAYRHFAEFAEGLARARAVAIANLGATDGATPGVVDLAGLERLRAQSFTTSVGLAGVVTVAREDGGFIHYLSLSWRGGFLPRAAAGRFLAFARRQLGLHDSAFEACRSARGVYHLSFKLVPERHEAVVELQPGTPDRADWRALFAALSREGQDMLAGLRLLEDRDLLVG